ncbi:Set1/Ash2 histone methyltransferase complex subunit [Acrasis kona]|uniref:Set1/Ash2 histone methyltransferase complex subunit n=1 Tax=Acrasis kona TaxID=1008807 RepID=A0AAW2ZLC2_9EUKA
MSQPPITLTLDPSQNAQNQQRQSFVLHIRDKYHQLDVNLIISHAFLKEQKTATDANPLNEEFSLQEDRLLMFVEASAKLAEDENGEEKKASGRDFVKSYAARARNKKAGTATFNKTNYTGAQFKERLASVRSQGGLRYAILQNSVSAEVEALRQQQSPDQNQLVMEDDVLEPKHSNIPNTKKQSVIMGNSISEKINTADRNRRHNVASGGKPFAHGHSVTSDSNQTIVEIVLSVRNQEDTIICAHENKLAHSSPYLKRLLESTAPQMSEILKEPVKQISFSEYDKQYRDYEMYGCFDPNNFNRLVMFVESPEIQDRYKDLQLKYQALLEQNQKDIDTVVNELIKKREEHLSTYNTKIEKQKNDMLRVLTKCREFDVERINTLYDVHIQNETEKLQSNQDSKQTEIEEYYDREIKDAQILFRDQQAQKLSLVQNEIDEARNNIEMTLPRNDPSIISLLILCDIVKAEELRSCCINILTQDSEVFEKLFAARESLSCSFLRGDTLKIIMSHLTTSTLLNLSNRYDYHFDRTFVLRELEYRKSIQAEEYKEVKIENLIDMQESGEILFPEILDFEILRRRNKKPFVHLSSQLMSPFLSLNDDQLTVSLKGLNRYSSLSATHNRVHSGWGKWYYEVVIVSFPASELGASISIGWDTFCGNSPVNYDGHIPGLTAGERNQYGYSWQSDGMFHYEGRGEFCESSFSQGDVVGCALNQDKKHIMFYKNGEKIVLIKREMKGLQNKKQIQNIHSVQITDKNYKLYPSACLYSPKKNLDCTIKFNFSGPFVYPAPPLYEAYGDERKIMRQQLEIKQKLGEQNNFVD